MRKSILVVENHHDLRSAIVAALTREHFACDSVGNGAAALLKLRDHNYEFIFVDDDEETAAGPFLARISADPRSQPKIVLLTEVDRADDVAFLRKPFDSKQLLARVTC